MSVPAKYKNEGLAGASVQAQTVSAHKPNIAAAAPAATKTLDTATEAAPPARLNSPDTGTPPLRNYHNTYTTKIPQQ